MSEKLNVKRGSVRGPDWDKHQMRWIVRWAEANGKKRAQTFDDEPAALAKRAELDEATPALEVALPALPRGFKGTAADWQWFSRELAKALWQAGKDGDNSKVTLLGKMARAGTEIADLAFAAYGYQEVVDELPEVEAWCDGIVENRVNNAAEKPEALDRIASALKSQKKRHSALH